MCLAQGHNAVTPVRLELLLTWLEPLLTCKKVVYNIGQKAASNISRNMTGQSHTKSNESNVFILQLGIDMRKPDFVACEQ